MKTLTFSLILVTLIGAIGLSWVFDRLYQTDPKTTQAREHSQLISLAQHHADTLAHVYLHKVYKTKHLTEAATDELTETLSQSQTKSQ